MYKDLEVEIKFDDQVEFAENLNIDLFDGNNPLQLNIINPDDSLLWEIDPPVLWGGDLRDPWETRAQIEVEEQGIYRINFEDLQEIGLQVKMLQDCGVSVFKSNAKAVEYSMQLLKEIKHG